MPNYAEDYYNRISSPEYAQQEIGRRYQQANPELQRRLAQIRADLNRRGVFSSAPVTRATFGAQSGLMNEISGGVFSDISQQRLELIRLLEQLREAERARKDARSSSLFGGIGSLLGMVGGQGLGFLLNKNLLSQLMNGGGQLMGTGEGNTYA